MANKKQSNDLITSLETIRELNWLDDIHELSNDVNKSLLDDCADIIQEFLENDEFLSTIPKKQVIKTKKRKNTKTKSKLNTNKSKPKKPKKNILSTNSCLCHPSTYPCFRSCGPINCPENKLPMPRDLWYRIVYSQALEQQLGSGESFIPQNQSVSHIQSQTKRKHKEDESEIDEDNLQSNHLIDLRQQTMNAGFSTTSTKLVKLDHEKESLPLEIEYKHSQSNHKIWKANPDKKVLFTQSADAELLNRPKIYHGISASATLEHAIPIQPEHSISNDNPSIVFEHPLIDKLYEYYHLEDIPRNELFKKLNRRLIHIHQTLKTMSSNDIEIKLKYKRHALVTKRQTPVQSLTKDERIAMAELELNVYEYVKALDEPSSKSFHVEIEPLPLNSSILTSYDTILPVIKTEITSDTSNSTFDTVRPSVVSQSTGILSPSTQFSDKTENFLSWTHPLLSNLMNKFEELTPIRKAQIHKQLARRYEHICKKAKQLNNSQLQSQINSKMKAIEQNKNLLQSNETDYLRLAELELCLFELEKEQSQRNSFD